MFIILATIEPRRQVKTVIRQWGRTVFRDKGLLKLEISIQKPQTGRE